MVRNAKPRPLRRNRDAMIRLREERERKKQHVELPDSAPHPLELPGKPQLPDWLIDAYENDPLSKQRWEEVQWPAIVETVEHYNDGADVVDLDAPTGTGKTLIGEVVRRLLKMKATYVCTTKSLQEQFLRDYPYSKVLKGRSNYPTQNGMYPMVTAADCTAGSQQGCEWCEDVSQCPYEQAKMAALRAPMAVVNTAYFLAEANYVGTLSSGPLGKRGQDQLVVVDEADVLEQELMGFVEFNITQKMCDDLDLDPPKKGSHKSTIADWLQDYLIPTLAGEQKKIRNDQDMQDVKWIRKVASIERLIQDAHRVGDELMSENWIRDNDAGPLVMRPVMVDEYAGKWLWKHGQRWLLMSATIISADEMAESLGMGELDWRVVRVPMLFPPENRPIHVAGVAKNTKSEQAESWPKLKLAIERILEEHEDEKVLVHTVTYKFAEYLHNNLDTTRPLHRYRNARERDGVVEEYRASESGVLLAPSLDRGVDFKDDDCRVTIVCKMPYPYLGSPQVSTRARIDKGWYPVQTIRKLVQMTGRGVRHMEDYCVTYIIDTEFKNNVWKRNKRLFPGWWKEALNFSYRKSRLM